MTNDSTEDKVVELLNQASLEEKADDKIHKLKLVEELVIYKEPGLLENFFEEVLAFQNDKSIDVKKYIVQFVELASRIDNNLLPHVISNLRLMFASENINVLKKLLLSSAQIFKTTFKWLAGDSVGSGRMRGAWQDLLTIHGMISDLIDADNDGLRTHAIKYLETVIITLSTPPSSQPPNDLINLAILRDIHWLLDKEAMEDEGRKAFDHLLTYQSSLYISSINLITVMGCMTNIIKVRPQFTQKVVQAFESLHVNLPPTLTKSQVNSVRKHLKNQLMVLIRLPSCSDFQPNMAILLNDLGVSQSEVSRHMGKNKKRSSGRKGRLTPSSSATSLFSMDKNSTDSDEDKTRTSIKMVTKASPLSLDSDKSAHNDVVMGGEEGGEVGVNEGIGGLDEYEEMHKNVERSAIDVTADDLVPQMGLENVVDLVMLNMVMLPDTMPASFQSTYTPISAAGTPAQVRHLARLLAVLLNNVGVGKGAEMEKEGLLGGKKKKKRAFEEVEKEEEEAVKKKKMKSVQAIQTLMGGKSESTEVRKISAKTEKVASVTTALPHERVTRKAHLKVEMVPWSAKQCHDLALFRLDHLLGMLETSNCLPKEVLWKKVISLSPWLSHAHKQFLVDYVFDDLRSRSGLALEWMYQEYIQAQDTNDLTRYEQCVVMVLSALLNRPDQKGGLFNKFVLEAPKLTARIMDLLKTYCLNEDHIYLGMMTLKQLILKNPSHFQQPINILLTFTIHPNYQVRQNAIRVVKSLHGDENLKEAVEEYATKSIKHVLSPTPPPELLDCIKTDEGAAWTEELTRNCLGLYLVLLPINQSLVHQLAAVYTSSSADIKRVILRIIESPVKGMGMNSAELLLLVETCPKGAETLVTRIIHILTDRAVPSAELVDRVRDLYQRRVSDVRFLIPVLNGITKQEVIEALPRLIKLSPVVVKEVFNRLLGLHSQGTQSSALSASELMITLHTLDSSKVDMKSVIKACNLCFAEKGIYSQETLAVVINELIEVTPLPTLFMRTVIQSLATYPKLVSFVMNIMQRLIGKQVWKNSKVWEGFVKCCQRTKPQSFVVLLQLPPAQLKDAFSICPELQEPLLSHVISFPAHQRAHIHKSIMSVLEKMPEKSVFAADQIKLEVEVKKEPGLPDMNMLSTDAKKTFATFVSADAPPNQDNSSK